MLRPLQSVPAHPRSPSILTEAPRKAGHSRLHSPGGPQSQEGAALVQSGGADPVSAAVSPALARFPLGREGWGTWIV